MKQERQGIITLDIPEHLDTHGDEFITIGFNLIVDEYEENGLQVDLLSYEPILNHKKEEEIFNWYKSKDNGYIETNIEVI